MTYGLPDSFIVGMGRRAGRAVAKPPKHEPHESWVKTGVEKSASAFMEGLREGWKQGLSGEKPKKRKRAKKKVRFVKARKKAEG